MKLKRTLPKIGDQLVHKFRKKPGSVVAKVISVDAESGEVSVQIEGKTYASLSAAAQAISGHASNGWTYWGLEKQRPKSRLKTS